MVRARGLLRDATLETLTHLGEPTFGDSSPAAGVLVVVFTLTSTPRGGKESAEEGGKRGILLEAIVGP
jgi:hypothetical protein